MDDVVGSIVVFSIIFVLIFALSKQIQYTKEIKSRFANSITLQKLNRKYKIMNVALSGIILFYMLNVFVGLGFVSNTYFSSNITAVGVYISLILYLISKFSMDPKNTKFSKSLY